MNFGLTLNESLGERIKRIRNSKGWSQETLARQSNMSYLSIVKIEQSKIKNPSLQSIYKIAKVFGMSLDILLEGVFNDEELFSIKKINIIKSDKLVDNKTNYA